MREQLKERNGRRGKFSGTVDRFGSKKAYKGPPIPTVCLVDIQDESGKQVADHVWMTIGKQLSELKLNQGDKIQFVARVLPYTKGYKGRRDLDDAPLVSIDYRLSHGTQFRKLSQEVKVSTPLPLFVADI